MGDETTPIHGGEIVNKVDRAAELNKQIVELTKELNDLKADIKSTGEGSSAGEKYVAIVKGRVTRKLNQEKTTEVVKRLGAKWLLKTIVDEEKLEDSLASGELSAEEFVGCVDEKKTYAVTFKEKK